MSLALAVPTTKHATGCPGHLSLCSLSVPDAGCTSCRSNNTHPTPTLCPAPKQRLRWGTPFMGPHGGGAPRTTHEAVDLWPLRSQDPAGPRGTQAAPQGASTQMADSQHQGQLLARHSAKASTDLAGPDHSRVGVQGQNATFLEHQEPAFHSPACRLLQWHLGHPTFHSGLASHVSWPQPLPHTHTHLPGLHLGAACAHCCLLVIASLLPIGGGDGVHCKAGAR